VLRRGIEPHDLIAVGDRQPGRQTLAAGELPLAASPVLHEAKDHARDGVVIRLPQTTEAVVAGQHPEIVGLGFRRAPLPDRRISPSTSIQSSRDLSASKRRSMGSRCCGCDREARRMGWMF
jgi:hypothetical protein